MGYVFQRGNVWWFQFYQDGQRVRMSSESTDERVAKQQLEEHEARVTLKEPLVVRSARVTYDELRQDLVQHYQATADRDLVEAGKRLKHLDRAFHGVRASRITGAAITEYIVRRQAEEIVSPKKTHRRRPANGTINREVGVLLRMLRLGAEHGKVARVPIVHKPKEAAPRAGFFEADAFTAVRAQLPADLQLAVTIAYTYGWRMQDEVLTLERRQVDLAEGTLRLDPGATKNDDGRVIYLTPELAAMLPAHLDRVHALARDLGCVIPWLFPHFAKPRRGTPRRDFRKAWITACKTAGYTGMLRHDFRRTAARNLVNAWVPEKVAMTITGHKTRSVFDRYHIVSPSDLKRAVALLGERQSATIPATISLGAPYSAEAQGRRIGGLACTISARGAVLISPVSEVRVLPPPPSSSAEASKVWPQGRPYVRLRVRVSRGGRSSYRVFLKLRSGSATLDPRDCRRPPSHPFLRGGPHHGSLRPYLHQDPRRFRRQCPARGAPGWRGPGAGLLRRGRSAPEQEERRHQPPGRAWRRHPQAAGGAGRRPRGELPT